MAVKEGTSTASARVLSYNFNILPRGSGGYQHERIDTFLGSVDAYDVVLLQEVYSTSYLPYALQQQFCYQKMLLDGLKAKGFHYYVISRQPSYRTIVKYNVCSDNGLIIASRFPIWHRGSYTFRHHGRSEATVSKGCLFAEIELPADGGQGSQRLVVFNVHLRPEDSLPPESSQMQQMQRFVQAALAQVRGRPGDSPSATPARDDVPSIIAGDFNVHGIDATSGAASRRFQDLLSQLQVLGSVREVLYDALGQNPPTRPPTLYFPKLSKLERFDSTPQRQDYFFADARIEVDNPHLEKFVVGSRRPYTYLSDHFGVSCHVTVHVDPTQVHQLRSPSRLNVSNLVEEANHEHSNPTSTRRLEALLLAVAAWCMFTISLKALLLVAVVAWVVLMGSQRYSASPVLGEPPLVTLEALKERGDVCMSNRSLNPLAGVQTLGEMWERSVTRFRTFRCLGATSELGEPEWMTYGTVDIRARELGAGLLEMGFQAGDLIGVECDPSRNAVILEVACALYGFTTVPLAGKRGTMRTILDQHRIRIAFGDRTSVATLLTCRSTKLETVIYTNAFADDDDHATAKDLNIRLIPFEYVEQKGRLNPVAPSKEDVTTDSVLTYTMDNTNTATSSDGCELLPVRHTAFLHDLGVLLMTGVLPPSYRKESMMWFSPMASLFHRVCVMGMLSQGNAIATADAAHLQEAFIKFRPTLLVTSPTLFSSSRLQLHRAKQRYGTMYSWMFDRAYQMLSRLIHIKRQDSAVLRFLYFRAFQRQLGGAVRKIILSVSQESTTFSLLEHISVCYVPSVCEVSYQNCLGVTTIDGAAAPSFAMALKPLNELSDAVGIGQVVVTRKHEPPMELEVAAQRKRDGTFTFLGAPLGVLWPVNFHCVIAVELERIFAMSRYVNAVFVYCEPLKPIIAVVYPNRDTIEFEWYHAHPVEGEAKPLSWGELVDYGGHLITEDLHGIATEEKLHPSQIPQYVHLHPHAFSDHSTFLTPFGKLRRDVVYSYFASVFERLYEGTTPSPHASNMEAAPEMSDGEASVSLHGGAVDFTLHVPATIDIGGTFAKIAFLMPPQSSDFIGFPSSIQEASSLSEKLGLRTFRFFSDESAAESELRHEPYSRVGTLRFLKVPSQQIPRFAEYLAGKKAFSNFKPPFSTKVRATGGGAFKYASLAHNVLGVEFDVVKEMDAVVKGLNLVLRIAPESVFTVDPLTGVHHPHKLVSSGDAFSPFPYLLINIGSGISFIKCTDADGSHVRVGGSPIGGATFWGLVRTMTNLTSWEEVMEIMRLDGPGDNKNVDLLVGDIYGYNAKDLPAMLSSETVASTFGKLGTERFNDMQRGTNTDHFADDDAAGEILSPLANKAPASYSQSPVVRNGTKAASAIDVVRSLLNMIAGNITQLSYLHSRLHNVPNIFFAGGFVRDNPMIWSLISATMKYWSSGAVHAHFLEHDGYLGALGCAMLDEHEAPNSE